MKSDLGRILGFFALVMILTVFWQPLVWLMIIVMVGLIIFGLRVMITSSRIKKDINQDPESYFNKQEANRRSQNVSSADIIDVEYTEREVSSDE